MNEQFDLLDLSQNEPPHGQPISQKRGSLARSGTCTSDPMRRSLQDRDSSECKDPDPDSDSLISQKRGSLVYRPVSAPMRRSMPSPGSNDDNNSGFDSDIRKENKRGHSSLNSSCPPDFDISSAPSCLSIDVGDTDLLAVEHEDGKRQRGYCKEGSLVSRFLRKLLLPSLSSLKFISDSKLSTSASKLSGLDIEKKEHAPGICDSPDAKETCGSQPSQDELEKNLLDRIEKMISCNSIASFDICEEADEDSSDSDDNDAPHESTVVSPIDLSKPFTETDLRSLFKALSSPLSCTSLPTNNVSSDGIDADFDAVLSSMDLTEKCRDTLKEIKKISSLENVSRTRPKLSRSINGLGASTPEVVDSTQISSSAPGTSVSLPTDNDIMLGKGAKSNNHSGNIRFRETVESMKPCYREQGTSKKGKKKVTLDCLKKIHAYGGRFLELVSVNPETWVVVQDNKAREKISQRIREKK
uniref:DUF6824 domain-containing protein n=1 Tax=Chaetoceros debilis TaxID=122233 RepID=A0A7S3PY48_9STRA|eukprot:CAMPEP_0194120752 /NCGR_PEP_ID=MMETSP0150-20130528/44473_1 /TAXON_ID=122233 /ORGANISM="Chaetoceros debilis, Strain MM31A-1" /LENGTH=469 /DNA_ID=CAMNT_0038812931 /DNA_START=56 /DNA_END=1465 /DNA_ORIENTATION=-